MKLNSKEWRHTNKNRTNEKGLRKGTQSDTKEDWAKYYAMTNNLKLTLGYRTKQNHEGNQNGLKQREMILR